MPIIPNSIPAATAERLLAFLNQAESPEALMAPGQAAKPPTEDRISLEAAKGLWDQRKKVGNTFTNITQLADVPKLTDAELQLLLKLFSIDEPVTAPPQSPPNPEEGSADSPSKPVLPDTPIDSLISIAGLNPELASQLESRGLRTLGDIAAKGGVRFTDLANNYPIDQLRLVDAHASLALVQPDPAINQVLYKRGVTSLRELAGLDAETVLDVQKEILGPSTVPVREAGTILLESTNATIDDFTNGVVPAGSPRASVCDCDDCRTAWSPLAYVADLIDYALDHVRDGNRALGATEFAKLLCQPIDQFTTDCRYVKDEVCAKRIACEVLRAYIAGLPAGSFDPAIAERAERRGLQLAYDTLLAELGASFIELRDSRIGSAQRRTQLASRLCIDETHLGDLFVDPANAQALTEATLERLFGLRSTQRFPLDGQPVAELATWRRACLEARWKDQDHPVDDYERGAGPFLDPDVVSADDLRVAGAQNNAAWNLWVARRNDADTIASGLIGLRTGGNALDVDSMLLAMFGSGAVAAAPLIALLGTPWQMLGGAPPTVQQIQTDFDQAATSLRSQINADTTRATLRDRLHLESDAFLRLMDLYQRFRNQLSLSVVEEDELANLCILGWKGARNTQWVQDERNALVSLNRVILDGRLCWRSLTEPLDSLPAHLVERNVPLIDPDYVQRNQLPDRDDGAPALLAARVADLGTALQALIALRLNSGFAALWAQVYQTVSPLPSYSALWTDFTNNVPGTDERIIHETLLSVADFNRVMDVVNLGAAASDRDWQLVCRLLLDPHKRLNLYPAWRAAEASMPRWQLLKACVDPWRSPRSARDRWVTALDRRLAWPIVVPMRLRPEDAVTAGGIVVQLLATRRSAVLGWQASWQSPATFTQIIPGAIGLSMAELGTLTALLDTGGRAAPRLRQLGISPNDLRLLQRLCDLEAAQPPLPILTSERDEGIAVLTKAQIALMSASWQHEERVSSVYRSPSLIAPPPQPAAAPAVEPTGAEQVIAPPASRRALMSILSARAESARMVDEQLARAIRAAEEIELRVFIDGLVDALTIVGATGRDAKAEWLTTRLFVDVKNDCCGRRTRAAQLAESVQSLLTALRNGLATTVLPTLRLQAPDFDNEWQWIGTYAAWRSAMLMFLYPENLLHPGLRPDRSPAFRALQDELRRTPRLTASRAHALAQAYERYLIDLDRLEVVGFLDVTYDSDQGAGAGSLLLQIGRADDTHYYCVNERGTPVSPARVGYWQVLPGLADSGEVKVIGMAHHRPNSGRHYALLLFTVTNRGRMQLGVLRFDFLLRTWTTESSDLAVPKPVGDSVFERFQAVVEQRRFAGQGGSPLRLWIMGEGDPNVVEWSLSADFSRLEHPVSHRIYATWVPSFRLEAAIGKSATRAHVIVSHAGIIRYADSLTQNWDQGLLPAVLSPVAAPAPVELFAGAISHAGRHYVAVRRSSGMSLTMLDDFGSAPIVRGLNVPANITRFVLGGGESATPQQFTVFDRGSTVGGTWSDTLRLPTGATSGIATSVNLTRVTPLSSSLARVFVIFPGGLDRSGGAFTSDTAAYSQALWNRNTAGAMNPLYIAEAQYAVPVLLALHLAQSGLYGDAIDWLRTVYDYALPLTNRKRWYGLRLEETIVDNHSRPSNWLNDPLSPHAIAASRRNAHTRYVILTLVRTLLAWADAEYTSDTVETLPRARDLYREALKLLALLAPSASDCDAVRAGLTSSIGDPFYENAWNALAQRLFTGVHDRNVLTAAIEHLNALLNSGNTPAQILNLAQHIVDTALAPVHDAQDQDWYELMQVRADWLRTVDMIGAMTRWNAIWEALHGSASPGPTLPLLYTFNSLVDPHFCIPPNPLINALVLRAEVNLFKLRHCLNIAGVPREVEAWGGAVDRLSILPAVGAEGTLALPGATSVLPSIYRYGTLLERAKQLVATAEQVEAAYLGALEKRDAEAWTMLQAQQGLETARATVRVHDLRVSEAESGIALAELQTERARSMVDSLQEFIDAGLGEYEQEMLQVYQEIYASTVFMVMVNTRLEVANMAMAHAQAGGNTATVLADKAQATAAMVAALIDLGIKTGHEIAHAGHEFKLQQLTIMAAQAARDEDLRYQQSLARFDVRIGEQQIRLAELRTRVVAQEREVAQLQADHAQEAVDFLGRKFTNVELYDWMSDVLGNVYAFFLRVATATAQQAAAQLAFERQSPVPVLIQQDYWDAPIDGQGGMLSPDARPDRRGLTGSARLLQDLYRLDQHAFETRRRQLELSRTFSLVLLDPIAFLRFRETGVLPFSTTLEMFDRDFPGHYLRLVRRVRVSVVALVPSTQGIRATLSSTGISRVVVGSDVFAERVLRREPERIAFTGARDASGQLGLEPTGDVLNPFEGSGVAGSWELRMDRASNPIDYSTITDVIITIEYTALHSARYETQVRAALDPSIHSTRFFSLRSDFADAWYDLHNPQQSATPMTVQFDTTARDFPPNLIDPPVLTNVQVYFALANGARLPANFLLTLDLGTVTGQQQGGAGPLFAFAASALIARPAAARWTMSLADLPDVRTLFDERQVTDILLVLDFAGTLA